MKILQKSQAGTFESSDVLILIEPVEENTGRKIEIQSSVMLQYGDNIKNVITEELDKFGIKDVHMVVNDKGALTPTIKARLETAVKRALNEQKGTL